MGAALIIIGVIWLIWQLAKEKSWDTNAYDGKELDVQKMFYDTNVKMTLGQMSKSEFKKNYKSGKYSK